MAFAFPPVAVEDALDAQGFGVRRDGFAAFLTTLSKALRFGTGIS
jgi:hypothetical protein